MSGEKLTRIRLFKEGRSVVGLMDWGELEPAEMVRQIRKYAAHLRRQVEAIEAAHDSEFRVDLVHGSAATKHVRTIQEGR